MVPLPGAVRVAPAACGGPVVPTGCGVASGAPWTATGASAPSAAWSPAWCEDGSCRLAEEGAAACDCPATCGCACWAGTPARSPPAVPVACRGHGERVRCVAAGRPPSRVTWKGPRVLPSGAVPRAGPSAGGRARGPAGPVRPRAGAAGVVEEYRGGAKAAAAGRCWLPHSAVLGSMPCARRCGGRGPRLGRGRGRTDLSLSWRGERAASSCVTWAGRAPSRRRRGSCAVHDHGAGPVSRGCPYRPGRRLGGDWVGLAAAGGRWLPCGTSVTSDRHGGKEEPRVWAAI